MSRTAHLDTAFSPNSVAVIGVGPITAGRFYVESLLAAGFKGSIYPIHPNGGEISGLGIHRNLRDVAGPVDLVISCIPARFVPELIRECAEKRVKVVSMFTSGFSETGSETGRHLEAETVRIAHGAGRTAGDEKNRGLVDLDAVLFSDFHQFGRDIVNRQAPEVIPLAP